MSQDCLTLPGGVKMPIFGLGTWLCQDAVELRQAVETALDAGYKLIDTARLYQNEHVIGEVLRDRFQAGLLKREDIFITTKVAPIHMGSKESVEKGFKKSLEALQLQYVDLYLIHLPIGLKLGDDECLYPKDANGRLEMVHHDLVETWKALEDLVFQGKVKAIGLSNFTMEQIERIASQARVPIANLQVECHAYFCQEPLVQFCRQRGITVTAYAPIGSPGRPWVTADDPVLLKDSLVIKMAERLNKTPAQVLLRFLLQRGIAVIPKSLHASRIRENMQIFDFVLSEEDMSALSSLDKKKRLFSLSSFPELKEHPEFPFHDAV